MTQRNFTITGKSVTGLNLDLRRPSLERFSGRDKVEELHF
jgi:hypothetical protein